MAFGIDFGPSPQENQNYGQLSNASNFATGTGEQDITQSDAFLQAILSGDPTKIAAALAPQISAAKTSAQQNAKTAAIGGNRGGGTNATNATAADKTHSDITGMISGLTGTAASALGSRGEGLLGTGISGTQAAFGDAAHMQQQHADQWNDIFKSVGSAAAAPFTGGASLGMGGFSMPGGGGGNPYEALFNSQMPAGFNTTSPDVTAMVGG